ncbi:MAG: hypothetical protein OXC91_10965 [Rhodobacteraceae bacterium]|nr:hypothetical protein [Paracoccaceae bacterium]
MATETKDIGRILEYLQDERNKIYFFKKIKDPKLFPLLKEQGLFDITSSESTDDNIGKFHPWPPIFYLEHLANIVSEKKLSDPNIIEDLVSLIKKNFGKLGNIPNSDHIRPTVVKILFSIPHCYLSVGDVTKAFDYLKGLSERKLTGVCLQNVFDKLVNNLDETANSKDIVCKYIELIFTYQKANVHMSVGQYKLSYFDRYNFERDRLEKLEEQFNQLGKKNKELIENLIEVFDKKLNMLLTEDKELDKLSGRWRPAVEKHYQNRYHDSAPSLFLGILFFLSSQQLENEGELKKLKEWVKSPFITYKRLYLALAKEFPKIISVSQSFEVFMSEDFNGMKGAKYERYYYLRKFYTEFSDKQKEEIINQILRIRNGEREVNIPKQLGWLHALEDMENNPEIQEKRKKLEESYKEITGREITGWMIAHPEFSDSKYFYGLRTIHTISPLPKDKVLSMKPDELINYLKEQKFDPIKEWKRPSTAGLAENLKQYVKHKLSDATPIVNNLLELDCVYVSSILDGLTELWTEKKAIPYKLALQKIKDLVGSPEFTNQLSDASSYADWVISSIAKFIEAGTNKNNFFKHETYDLSFEILKTLLEKVKPNPNANFGDAYTYALNEPRGKIIGTFIYLTSWQHEYENKEDVDKKEAWKNLKDFIIREIGKDGEFSLHALIGEKYGWFLYMDKNWFDENLNKIVPYDAKQSDKISSEKLWKSFIHGFGYTNFYNFEVYEKLNKKGVFKAYLRQERERKEGNWNSSDSPVNRIIDFSLIAYVSEGDEGLINLILKDKQENEWSCLFNAIATIYGRKEELRREYFVRIRDILKKVFETTIKPTNDSWNRYFASLDSVLEVFDDPSDEYVNNIIEIVSKHAEDGWRLYRIIDYLHTHKDKHCRKVGELYCVMLDKTSFAPVYPEDKIREICQKLDQSGEKDSLKKICRFYEKWTVDCSPIRDICISVLD